MVSDDDPVFEKNADELDDVELDEEDDDEENNDHDHHHDFEIEIDSIVDKDSGMPIDFNIERAHPEGSEADSHENSEAQDKF